MDQEDGAPPADSSSSITSRTKSLAVFQRSSPQIGDTEIGTSFCWPFPYLQGHQPGCCSSKTSLSLENAPHLPCQLHETLQRESIGSHLQTPSTPADNQWKYCLLGQASSGSSSSLWGLTVSGGLGGLPDLGFIQDYFYPDLITDFYHRHPDLPGPSGAVP